MQAIRTRYCGPTNTKGSRIQAKCEAATIYVEYDHALDTEDNHRSAALALATNLGWDSDAHAHAYSGVFDGDYYWVFVGPVEL